MPHANLQRKRGRSPGMPADIVRAEDFNAVVDALQNTPTLEDLQSPVNFKGVLTNTGSLPSGGNTTGDAYLVNGVVWVWSGGAWTNQGSLTAGPQGEPAALRLKGTKATIGDLPTVGNVVNDVWVVDADSHGYGWTADHEWVDVGELRGPQGPGGEDTALREQIAPPTAGDPLTAVGRDDSGDKANVPLAAPNPDQRYLHIVPVNETRAADGEVVNVRTYGIEGGANERSKVQTLVDNIRAGTRRRRVIYWPALPNGETYQTDDSIQVTEDANVIAGLTRWEGEHRNKSIIEMIGDANKPILLYQNDYGTYGTDFYELQLKYARRPTSGDTQRYGIQIRADTAGTAASGGGVYLGIMEKMVFDNCFVGIGEYGTGASTMPFWSMQFRDITIFHTYMNAFKFVSGGGTIGHPNVKLDNINILNYDQGSMGTGDGVKNAGPAILASAMSGFVINGLNIEDWWNSHLQITGGSYTLINGLRLERPRLDAAYPVLFTLNNLTDEVHGVDLGSIQQKTGLDFGRVFDTYGSQAVISSVTGQRDATNSDVNKAVYILQSDPSASGTIVANNIRPTSPVQGFDATGNNATSIRQYNGAPPVWNRATMPTASAYYKGALAYQLVSNVETLYACRQTGSGTYAWTALH